MCSPSNSLEGAYWTNGVDRLAIELVFLVFIVPVFLCYNFVRLLLWGFELLFFRNCKSANYSIHNLICLL
ncbi:hypothetical protein ACET3Z_002562 [Daucus carota]